MAVVGAMSRLYALCHESVINRTYAAVQSLADGLKKSSDPIEIAQYLKGATVETVMGPLSWNEKGDLEGFEFGVFTWNADGTSSDAK